MNLGQLKILQEVIALTVFVPFVPLYSKEKLTLDYLWASLCLLGAAFFVFRSKMMGVERHSERYLGSGCCRSPSCGEPDIPKR